MAHTLPIFDATECERALDAVNALRRYWTERHPVLPSYTLGAAAYLDVPARGRASYFVLKTRVNPFLTRELGWMYTLLVARLAEHLGAPTELTPRYALPGFHIFAAHERMGDLKPKLHFDLQHEDLGWEEAMEAPHASRFSFTVPLKIPKAGAGLDVWDVVREDLAGLPYEEAEALVSSRKRTYFGYQVGEAVLHDGNHLHQISADHAILPGEQRVTLQGHGFFSGSRWILYW